MARSTTICFRGTFCPYLAADCCMFSHAFFQKSYSADSPNGFAVAEMKPLFRTACSAVSPQQYHSITTETFTRRKVTIHDVPRLDQSEVERFFPTARPTTSPQHRLSKSETITQNENTHHGFDSVLDGTHVGVSMSLNSFTDAQNLLYERADEFVCDIQKSTDSTAKHEMHVIAFQYREAATTTSQTVSRNSSSA